MRSLRAKAKRFLKNWFPKSWNRIHLWSKPEIITVFKSTEDVLFEQKCLKCGSIRKRTLSFKPWYGKEPLISDPSIKYVASYVGSECDRKRHKRYKVDEEREKRLREKERRKNIREERISRNIKLLKNLGWNQKDRLRRNLTIYRLYRYLDLNFNQISYHSGLNRTEIQNIIGTVFSTLCVSSDSCVFKNILLEGKNK